jgi:hypothetical protein
MAEASSLSISAATERHIRWRELVDNCLVELIASLFFNLATLVCWPDPNDAAIQFMAPLTLGLILLCIKDEDYFFPDGAPTVTFVLWILGGYAWQHVIARFVGQGLGFGLALTIGAGARLPPFKHRYEHPLGVLFALELLGTMLEHLAVVYVLLPLLPPATPSHRTFPKVKPKAHPDTQPPANASVMHAALVIAVLHWCLWRGFGVEMNPCLTMLIALLYPAHGWDFVVISLWGQAVGVGACLLYAGLYVPRDTKLWPARHLKS